MTLNYKTIVIIEVKLKKNKLIIVTRLTLTNGLSPCKVITHFCFSHTRADISHEPLIREPNLPAASEHTKTSTADLQCK